VSLRWKAFGSMPAPPDDRRVDSVQHAKDERWNKSC
jgi:hypothetical protein